MSFAKRVRETLPPPYAPLITEGKMKDTPDFKYDDDSTPYAAQGREVHALLRKKTTTEEEIQTVLDSVQTFAASQGVEDPLVPSTDVYMTCICHVGSKTLSHVLSSIERCKERLLAIGPQSSAARRQIISSVMSYWAFQPGTAVNIIDKLLNYTIITPMSVIEWALHDRLDAGRALAQSHTFEMVSATMGKVTNRVRQIVAARNDVHLDAEQLAVLDETLVRERQSMRDLFAAIEEAVAGVAAGADDGMIERYDDGAEVALIRAWGERWTRVWRRKAAVEEASVGEAAVEAAFLAARAAFESAQVAEAAAAADAATAAARDGNGNGEVEHAMDDVDEIA